MLIFDQLIKLFAYLLKDNKHNMENDKKYKVYNTSKISFIKTKNR